MTTTDIVVEIEELTNQRLSVNQVGEQMLKLGFEKKTSRVNREGMPPIIQKRWGVNKINREKPVEVLPKVNSIKDLPF